MNNEPRDILLSLRYYLADHIRAYNNEYDIRIAIEEDAFARPCAVVQTGGPAVLSNEHRRIAKTIRPFAIYVYPQQGPTAKAAELEAARVEGIVAAAFQRGGFRGHPARIPLYDWSAVEDEGDPLPEDAKPIAWAKIEDSSVDHKADGDDETLTTIWANLRLSWHGIGEAYPESETLESVKVSGSGT